MLLNDDEIKERIESPINLLNRLKTSLTKTVGSVRIPSMPPKAEDVITDLEDKIANTTIKTKTKSILAKALTELESRITEVQKPERLASIAREMGQLNANQEDSRRNHGTINSQIIVYAPQVQNLENFEIIDVTE